MVKDIAKLPQVQPLGKIWSYNNAGFNIASRLIEVITGKTYERAAQEMLFDPLGLKMSFFFPSDILITHRFVSGHYNKNKKTHGYHAPGRLAAQGMAWAAWSAP